MELSLENVPGIDKAKLDANHRATVRLKSWQVAIDPWTCPETGKRVEWFIFNQTIQYGIDQAYQCFLDHGSPSYFVIKGKKKQPERHIHFKHSLDVVVKVPGWDSDFCQENKTTNKTRQVYANILPDTEPLIGMNIITPNNSEPPYKALRSGEVSATGSVDVTTTEIAEALSWNAMTRISFQQNYYRIILNYAEVTSFAMPANYCQSYTGSTKIPENYKATTDDQWVIPAVTEILCFQRIYVSHAHTLSVRRPRTL